VAITKTAEQLITKLATANDPAFKAAIKSNKELRAAYLAAQVANGGNINSDQLADLAKKHGVKLTPGNNTSRPRTYPGGRPNYGGYESYKGSRGSGGYSQPSWEKGPKGGKSFLFRGPWVLGAGVGALRANGLTKKIKKY
jgi:hypothetical protein